MIPTVCLLLVLGVFRQAAIGGEISVRAMDILNSRGVAGAAVTVRERIVELAPGGERRLRPLPEGIFVGSFETAEAGEGNMEIAVEGTSFLSVEISAEGYLTQVESLLRVEEGKNSELTVYLVREQLTEEQAEEVRIIQEEFRGEVEQGPFVAPGEGELRAFAAVTVPDEVRVENLNGFTGLMNLDEFIGGVVTREMNDGFPREALRAQAVASRSYALHRLRTRGMANGGQAYSSTSGSLSRAAAIFTSKQVLLYNGGIAQAFFSARCHGDFTLDSEDGPTLDRCFPGGLTTAVVPYCRSKPCSGHINCSETSEQCCEVTINNKVNYIYGHGVGLCQRGAQQFASRDQLTYGTILSNYYTSVTLHTGTNSLQLRLVTAAGGGDAEPPLLLEVRSGQPNTIFDIQSAIELVNPLWSSLPSERALITGPSGVVELEPHGLTTGVRYYRALLR